MIVAHVSDCYPPRTGGIESQVGDLAARQAAAGHEVHVLTATLGEGGERGGVVDLERGVHVHRLGARMPFSLPVNPVEGRLIDAALREVRPDVVHVHAGVLSPFAFDGARAARRLALPLAITWHCMLDGVVPVLRAGARASGWRDARAALSAVSGVAAARVADVFGADVSVVPNGLDLARWADVAAGTRSAVTRTGHAVPPLRLVATMRLAPRKRAVPLVDLVARATQRLPAGAVRLDVIGDGPDRGRVAARVELLGLGDVVTLRGRLARDDVRAAYADADVFLAPAELEAFGIAALEARAAGLVVVARRGTGIEEFVADGTDGLLVADDAAMSDAVVRLARERPVLDAMRTHNAAVLPDQGWDRVLRAADAEYARARSLARG
ncbi:glycosyltransferase family 4 protein [uncultured Cellulomonas sp.]|uniref:glycosyltransferase family 4 protein n=1 Tax=uncultured Cellulomonas sp. TaxID=189682 RepID=UPI0026031E3E|nr:glycosyltransferase family 4 protein [uncultured Cellulomonas sp.]